MCTYPYTQCIQRQTDTKRRRDRERNNVYKDWYTQIFSATLFIIGKKNWKNLEDLK